MSGIKHLIDCHCYLAIYRKNKKLINHKFPVYSSIDEAGKVIPRYAKCNNCDTLHYVNDICKSEIRGGKDQTEIVISIDDISNILPVNLCNILRSHNCDISDWEHVLDIIDSKRWGSYIVIKRDIIKEVQHVKILKLLSRDSFKISVESINNIIMSD